MFGGKTYDREQDDHRLGKQLLAVYDALRDGDWHTLDELLAAVPGREAAITARIRDFRKPDIRERMASAGYPVAGAESKRVAGRAGVWAYRLILPAPEAAGKQGELFG